MAPDGEGAYGRREDRVSALFRVGAVGSVVAALCCAGIGTPLLAAALTAAGLGVLTRNLDLVLLPALAAFLAMAGVGWWRRSQPSGVRATGKEGAK